MPELQDAMGINSIMGRWIIKNGALGRDNYGSEFVRLAGLMSFWLRA